MGVKVKEWKGAWWLFIHYQGQRKAKRVGTGPAGKRAAERAHVQIQPASLRETPRRSLVARAALR